MKKQIQQNNDNKKEITFQLMLLLDIGIKIDADASVHTLFKITERMDYSRLNAAYRRLPGESFTIKRNVSFMALRFTY